MATPTRATLMGFISAARPSVGLGLLLWLVAAGVLTAALALLTIAVNDGPVPSQDRTVLDWVVERDAPGLAGLMRGISGLTSNFPALGLGLGIAGIVFLWLIGLNRAALAFAIVGGMVGVVAFAGDLTLGEIVGRSRPLLQDSDSSFPSEHVFGSTVFFGFWGFLGVYYRLNRRGLALLLGTLVALILAVGFSRMFEQAHWPSDVAAGYLLGGLWLLLLIPFFVWVQRLPWKSTPKQAAELYILECDDCRVESSIASTVVLDPEGGNSNQGISATGGSPLDLLAGIPGQLPYEHNRAALDAATYRRKIASALTIHRFGKDLVAHVTAVNCMYGPCSFVTEFIPGEKVENDEAAKEFLGQVAETFAEAGLSVWQVNPRNPHAHTNLIRTPDGDSIIIDLESAIPTPIPAPGQWRSALRRGTIPIFDDLDFGRLRDYLTANQAALEASLGREGLVQLRNDVELCEQAILLWQSSEPRIWGRLISGVYRLLDLNRFLKSFAHTMEKADGAAELFLSRGVERWEDEGRLSSTEIARLRSHLSSGEVQEPIHHLGAHLVLSMGLLLPIPGLRSLARFVWTLTFWIKRRFGRGATGTTARPANVHTPLVMILALIRASEPLPIWHLAHYGGKSWPG